MLRSVRADAPARGAAALAGLRAYQHSPRVDLRADAGRRPRRVRARLEHGAPGRPLMAMRSFIDGCEVLDLLPEGSFMHRLVAQVVHPLPSTTNRVEAILQSLCA